MPEEIEGYTLISEDAAIEIEFGKFLKIEKTGAVDCMCWDTRIYFENILLVAEGASYDYGACASEIYFYTKNNS